MDKQETKPALTTDDVIKYVFADLENFGFKSETVMLKCRICGALITRATGATLLNVPVKYGRCKKRSHGVSIVRIE